MRLLLFSLAAALASAIPTAVEVDNTGHSIKRAESEQDDARKEAGAVWALTNNPDKNEVVSFARAPDGTLTEEERYATGGRGQGVDFDTQGGLTLNKKGTYLYAVNPASDTVTVFATQGGSRLKKVQSIYAGDQPLSITLSNNGYAYVLDGSVASTGVFGFKVDEDKGTLTPLTNKTVPLSTPIGVPGVVLFSPDDKALVVANKVGSTLDVFKVGRDGKVGDGPVTVAASSGMRPFAATFDKYGYLYVVEAGLPSIGNAGVSTYRLGKGDIPALSPITKSEKNGQTDGCWVVATPNGKWAYTANFVSGTISSYATDRNGTASLLKGDAWSSEGSEPVDLALSADGKYLYNLLRGSGGVISFKIQKDGSIKKIGKIVGKDSLPGMFGVSGLAAL